GLGIGYQLSPVLRTAGAPVAALDTPRNSALGAYLDKDVLAMTTAAYAKLGARGSTRPGRDAVNRGARLTKYVADALAPTTAPAGSPGSRARRRSPGWRPTTRGCRRWTSSATST